MTERKIHFLRVESQVDLADVLTEIDKLPITQMYSFVDDEGGGLYLRSLETENDMSRGELARVRMSGLPTVATHGKRLTEALQIAHNQGLAETTHFIYFKQSKILAVEYNHFGPRAATLETYIIDIFNELHGEPLDLTFKYILDEDTIKLLGEGSEIRLLQMAVPKERIGNLARYDTSIFEAFDNAARFGDSGQVEIVLRKARRSRGKKPAIKEVHADEELLAKTRLLASGPKDTFEKLRVSIKPLDDRVQTVDLLENKVTVNVTIESDGRSRDINSAALFRAIQQAYQTNAAALRRLSEYEPA